MGRRADIIVTACVLLSLLLAVSSLVLVAVTGAAYATVSIVAACYLVAVAMFVVAYSGRNDG